MKRRGEVKDHCLRHGSMNIVTAISSRARRAPRTMAIELAACLVVALLFWASVIAGKVQTRETTISVPMEYSTPPKNFTLAGDRIPAAKLLVKGSSSALARLDPARLRVNVDLAPLPAGKQTVSLTEENIELPKGVTILQIKPASVTVDLKPLVTRKLEIIPQLVGEAPSGYKITGVEVKPKTLSIQVIEDAKKDAEPQLLTTPIYLQGIRKSVTVFCKIIEPNDALPVDKRWPDVEVTLTIERNN